jgi:hypothetical protein
VLQVAYGSTSGLRYGTPWIFPIEQVTGCTNGAEGAYDRFPRSGGFAGAGGDLDGDGYDDVVVAVSGHHLGTASGVHHCDGTPSVAELHYGGASGLDPNPVQTLSNPADSTRDFPMVTRYVGALVPAAGGDELLIGTPAGYGQPEQLDILGGGRGQVATIRSLF